MHETPVPQDTIPNIEGTRSSSPVQGSDVSRAENVPGREMIYEGRVDDVYSRGICLVSIFNFASHLPCFPLQSIMAGVSGASDVGMPSIGSRVDVYVPRHKRYGLILGCADPLDPNRHLAPSAFVEPGCNVNLFSQADPWVAEDFNRAKGLPDSGAGIPADVLPGDRGWANEFGVFLGILRLAALLRATDLAKVEAFVVDNLLRLTGHNFECLTGAGETRDISYEGRVSHEESYAITHSESLGASEPGQPTGTKQKASVRRNPDKTGVAPNYDDQTGKWRYRRFIGAYGDVVQELVSVPGSQVERLSTAETNPDVGVYQRYVDRAGRFFERSVAGGGLYKTNVIAVPKRIADPASLPPHENTSEPIEDFDFGDDPLAVGTKIRDYLAYQLSKLSASRFQELKDEFSVPDEASSPSPFKDNRVPGDNGFFREFLEAVDVLASGITDPHGESRTARPGTAGLQLTPDGGFSLFDAWGCGIESRGGRLIVHSSNGIELHSGKTVSVFAGDDLILKARNSMDLSSTNGQTRIASGEDVLVHSRLGGIQLTAEGTSKSLDDVGEEYHVPGIVLNARNSGVTLTGQDVTAEAEGTFGVKSTMTSIESMAAYFTCPSGVYIGDDAKAPSQIVAMFNGNIYGSGGIGVDGSIFSMDSIVARGDVGGNATGGEPVGRSLRENYRVPEHGAFEEDELEKVRFTYRTTEQYGAQGGRWYQLHWQRDLASSLSGWEEAEIEGTYPYPGEAHYTGSDSFFTYQEKNVLPGGTPVTRESMDPKGGELKGHSFHKYPTFG